MQLNHFEYFIKTAVLEKETAEPKKSPENKRTFS